jgi:hypothetical protein
MASSEVSSSKPIKAVGGFTFGPILLSCLFISPYIGRSPYFWFAIIFSIFHFLLEYVLGPVLPDTLNTFNYHLSMLTFSVIGTWAWFIPSILWTLHENTTLNSGKISWGWVAMAGYLTRGLIAGVQAIKEKERHGRQRYAPFP